MIRQVLIGVSLLALGFTAGWHYRHQEGSEPVAKPIETNGSPDLALHTQTPVVITQSELQRNFGAVRVFIDEGRFAAAYEMLLNSLTLTAGAADQEEFSSLLAILVDQYTKHLVALGQQQRIDGFYEQLTLDLPQYAEYQLRLGKLRVQMGNAEAALLPLAQVSNHARFGAEARLLIDQIENREQRLGFAEIPLTGNNGQFIVSALLDESIPIKLLIDTGAAITAIDEAVLQRAGYDLNAERHYFSTANGVVAAPVLNVSELSLGEAKISGLSVGALPLALPSGVVGLLGMNFLRHYEFRIDQGKSTLILERR